MFLLIYISLKFNHLRTCTCSLCLCIFIFFLFYYNNIISIGRTAGSAAVAAELRKHSANDAKCSELGWTCIPLVAESYGAWGNEAMQAFSRLASYHATRTNSPKSKVVCSLYGRLNLTLVRANARALLLRCGCSLQEGDSSSLSLS